MSQVQFSSPTSVTEAIQSLSSCDGNKKVLAGGTDLLVQLRAGMISPDLIVDIKRIPELRLSI